MTAVISRVGTTVDALDFFCGWGGSSQGIHAAGATIRVAANHNEMAIDCHSRNWPDVDHRRADLSNPDSSDYVDPASFPPARFVWASPSCRFHSKANAKKIYAHGPSLLDEDDDFDNEAFARSERSRVTMLCPLRYAAHHHPEIVVVENVTEACQWGPNRDGTTFRWWLNEWQKIGYEFECCFLNSQFFPPCPQSRDRVYIVFWRKGNRKPDLNYKPLAYCISDRCGGKYVDSIQSWKNRKPSWPLPRWGKYGAKGGQYIYTCPNCGKPVDPAAWPAYTAIDWSNLGSTIGDRASNGLKPLAAPTIERIRRGLTKFRGGPPIIIPAKSQRGTDRMVTQPMATQTRQQEYALAAAGITATAQTHSPLRYAGNRNRSISETLFTATANQIGQGLVTEGIVVPAAGNTFDGQNRGGSYVRARPLSDQMFTQHTTEAFGFAHMPFITEMRGGGSVMSGQHAVTDPDGTVTAGGYHHGLASPALFAKFNGGPGDTAWHTVDDPFNTVTCGGDAGIDSHGLVVLPWVDQWMSDPVEVTRQLATVMTHMRHSLATVPYDSLPITDDDLEGVHFRMLSPDPELRRTMAFGASYILIGSDRDKTAGLGNSVTPPVATWLTERCLATLSDDLDRMSPAA